MLFKEKKYLIKRKDGDLEIDDALMSDDGENLGRIEHSFNSKILTTFWCVILCMILAMLSRVFYLGVVKGEYYNNLALENKTRNLAIKAPRGKIFDRFGKPLVFNVPSIDLVINPLGLTMDENERVRIIDKLSSVINGINREEALEKIKNIKASSSDLVVLVENISQEDALKILEISDTLPGVSIEKTAIRKYTDSVIFSHILGYEGKIKPEELQGKEGYFLNDSIGKQGLEKYYEKYLRGNYGKRKIEVDSKGRAQRELEAVQPTPGSDLLLNIDSELQKKIFDSLGAALEKEKLNVAAGVAMNPKNGEILAMVSIPSFDNNLFSGGISSVNYKKIIEDENRPMFNRAVSGEYPPGSTIKPLLAAAALNEGVINENTQIESKGGIQVGDYFFGDWKAHGMTDVRQAIAVSSDVFFYSVGGGYGNIEGMGMSTMKKYENLFGLGEETGIDLTGEASGFIPTEEWKLAKIGEKWYKGNTYHASIGQGYVTTTPLQLASYISAIANGGILYKPRMVSQIKVNDGSMINNKPEIIRKDLMSKKILKIVQEGMRMTVTEGTAKLLNDLPISIAGKTGTAQYGSDKKAHGWFVSYAPYEDPEIALVILVEGQSEDGHNAVPIARDIYEWYLNNRK